MSGGLMKPSADLDFLTGVVEGFYGRPWTYPQRKELFRRMNHMGMNAYLYAPKDDIKHRQSWRDLYTTEEEQQLQSLITESTEAGILFIFALSPGLDVTFSSAKEVDILKKKVDQVSKLGCRAFALLFDDIEPRLCPADREVFTSSARAQVVFANDLYNYLGCPNVFLFCPTEYSASLAVPNISKSEYLSTVASYLAPDIAIIWTGPLVVSKNILAKELEELTKLLQHPIVLWDNLHANDYDQRRVFIGPYSGRSLALRRKGLIRGVLTNPNCEFEANYVALHTLAQWSRHGTIKPQTSQITDKEMTDVASRETNLEPEATEAEDDDGFINDSNGPSDGINQPSTTYRPREALLVALRDWLSLMRQDQQSHTANSKSSGVVCATPVPMETDIAEPPPSAPEAEMQVEPLMAPSPSGQPPLTDALSDASGVSTSVDVTLEDLELFADLFYLPFAHGPAGMRLLELGHWLREHSHACGLKIADPERDEWIKKLSEFVELVSSVSLLRDRIQRLPSRSIAYELAPYITEMHTVLGMVLDYFRWLETGVMATRSMCHLRRLLTWFSPGYRDMVTSGDQEPWTFRGGLITELQRILPLESAQDLFPAPSRAVPGMNTMPPNPNWPDSSSSQFPGPPFNPLQHAPPTCLLRHKRSHSYVVRPYQPQDKPQVYALFRRLLFARVGLSESALPPELHDLPGDRYLLHFLEHSPENCLVVEGPPLLSSSQSSTDGAEESRCVGFGLSTADAVAWARGRTQLFKEVLRQRYPLPVSANTIDQANQKGLNAAAPADVAKKRSNSSSRPESPAVDDVGSSPLSLKPPLTIDELIKFLLHPFHSDNAEVADIADAAAVFPPPEPLGAALPIEPALSGCLESAENNTDRRPSSLLPPNVEIPPNSFPVGCNPSVLPPNVPTPIIPDTAPPSPPVVIAPTVPIAVPSESCSSSPVSHIPGLGRPMLVAGGPEALHTALTAHPATLWVEFDDIGVLSCASGLTPTVLMNYNLGLGADPPELVLDSIARRLFICLLAALKTIGAHGCHVYLDSINEHRAELYRRFGFYPVPAASNDQSTVLARLI
ncbi:hypothetical protein CRM22_006479 [Opisthorchis felineus]|uniref:protein O-GlcNAcase n=1 Tax=Opisthorchis felineus TaxID=147828 RepID=A0A4S2LKR5_OPIFE|nr:hypothetical protein CRM22_006479 [Opisthorchis felineus]